MGSGAPGDPSECGACALQPASDGATPAYIAAQSGFDQCLEVLAALGADLKRCDKVGFTPLHQVRTSVELCLRQRAR